MRPNGVSHETDVAEMQRDGACGETVSADFEFHGFTRDTPLVYQGIGNADQS